MRYKEQDKYLCSAADLWVACSPHSGRDTGVFSASPGNIQPRSQPPHLGAGSAGGEGVSSPSGYPPSLNGCTTSPPPTPGSKLRLCHVGAFGSPHRRPPPPPQAPLAFASLFSPTPAHHRPISVGHVSPCPPRGEGTFSLPAKAKVAACSCTCPAMAFFKCCSAPSWQPRSPSAPSLSLPPSPSSLSTSQFLRPCHVFCHIHC